MSERIPLIAIVGCPNVGKSTLFNRIFGSRKSIVEDEPGVTRDRVYAFVDRFDLPFSLVDTGGIDSISDDVLAKQVRDQALLAIDEADVILALFDGAAGVQPGDEEVVDLLRRQDKPVLFVVNKCDGKEQAIRAAAFYELGVPELLDCSALHGRAVESVINRALESIPDYHRLVEEHRTRKETQELEAKAALEEYAEEYGIPDEYELSESEDERALEEEAQNDPEFAPVFLPDDGDAGSYERTHRLRAMPVYDGAAAREMEEEPDAEDYRATGLPATLGNIRVAIIGRPNVGKSTMLNTLIGESRAIVSPVAGTTRDSLDVDVERDGQRFTLIDTAGVRRQGRISERVERHSVIRSLAALSNCDVAVLVLDGIEGPTEQDAKMAGIAHDEGRGLIIAVNKWDAVEKDHRSANSYKEAIKEHFKFAPYAPVFFTSARSGRRCENLLKSVREVAFERMRRVPTNLLNRKLEKGLRRVSPPSYRGQPVKLYFATQVDVAPPRFALFFNSPKGIHFSYLRFIKNAIRETFGFEGTDLKLMMRKK